MLPNPDQIEAAARATAAPDEPASYTQLLTSILNRLDKECERVEATSSQVMLRLRDGTGFNVGLDRIRKMESLLGRRIIPRYGN